MFVLHASGGSTRIAQDSLDINRHLQKRLDGPGIRARHFTLLHTVLLLVIEEKTDIVLSSVRE